MDELELLYQAIGTKHGIAIRVDNFSRTQQRLHQVRAKAGDTTLTPLRFLHCPWPGRQNELWIVHGVNLSKKGTVLTSPASSADPPDIPIPEEFL